MLAQVGSSSYTEVDSKRKTSSGCRRNGIRMGGNGKPTRKSDRGKNGEAVTGIIGRGKTTADACVGVRITCIDSPGGRVRKWGKFHGGRTVVGSFWGMKNVPGWRRCR